MPLFLLNNKNGYKHIMHNLHDHILDRFLSSVEISALDEAEHFVRELKFMCTEFVNTCPITLYKRIPTDKQPNNFFRAKNRHRTINETGSILNQALQQEKAFERGLDLDTKHSSEQTCIVFLPDRFNVSFSHANVESFAESAAYVDSTQLASIAYNHNIEELTEAAQHVLVSSVPFYYCIRFK